VLNLQIQEGREVVYRLVRDFDVVMINGRPGVPKRLGIDYETLRQYRPDLIYLENTAYGTSGPASQLAGSDVVAQAYSGLMAGEAKLDEYGAPDIISCTAVADRTAGMAGALGVVTALFHRQRTGEGQYVETSLLQAALSVQDGVVGRIPTVDAFLRDPMMERINEVRAKGGSYDDIVAVRGSTNEASRGGRNTGGLGVYYGGYRAKDGGVILGALTPANRDALRRVFGIEDDDSDSPDFNALDPANVAKLKALQARVREQMLTRTVEEWIALFDEAGAPASRVGLPEEMADDPQVEALGLMVDLDHDATGPERLVGPILKMSATPPVAHRAAPPLGRDTVEVLEEAGFAASEIEELRTAGALA
jgi:formyl-CoA transferase